MPEPCDLTSLIDEFVRIRRATTVIFDRDLIENLAVTTCRRFWHPSHSFTPLIVVGGWLLSRLGHGARGRATDGVVDASPLCVDSRP